MFLYNSELWTLNKTTENKIDAFQRRQLRYIINHQWPKKISNVELYKLTNVEPWSITIKRRRLNWLGHLVRLPSETPAKQALLEGLKLSKRKRGRPPLTWIKLIKQDLSPVINLNTNLDPYGTLATLHELCGDRKNWHSLVSHVMSGNQT